MASADVQPGRVLPLRSLEAPLASLTTSPSADRQYVPSRDESTSW
jgi:hypothetical protein